MNTLSITTLGFSTSGGNASSGAGENLANSDFDGLWQPELPLGLISLGTFFLVTWL